MAELSDLEKETLAEAYAAANIGEGASPELLRRLLLIIGSHAVYRKNND